MNFLELLFGSFEFGFQSALGTYSELVEVGSRFILK